AVWAVGLAALAASIIAIFGPALIDLLTIDEATRAAARVYLPWVTAAPLLGVWAFQLDGIFIGATRTVDMRNAMLLSLAIFLAGWWLLTPFANHGLWAALHVHYLARIGTLAYFVPRLISSVSETDHAKKMIAPRTRSADLTSPSSRRRGSILGKGREE